MGHVTNAIVAWDSCSRAMQVQVIIGEGRNAIAVQCNVQSDAAQQAAFKRHLAAWNCLDIAILNAGIFEKGASLPDSFVCCASREIQADTLTCHIMHEYLFIRMMWHLEIAWQARSVVRAALKHQCMVQLTC